MSNRYGIKRGNTTVDLLNVRRITKSRSGFTLRYSLAFEQEAYAPLGLVAWQGRYDSPDNIDWQQSGETNQEFVRRFESNAIWK